MSNSAFEVPTGEAGDLLSMSKLEKKLCVFAIVFVVIYLGAAGLTIRARITEKKTVTRLEPAQPDLEQEAQLMLAELFLPMMILLTVTVSFIIVRKKRAKDILVLDETEETSQERYRTESQSVQEKQEPQT